MAVFLVTGLPSRNRTEGGGTGRPAACRGAPGSQAQAASQRPPHAVLQWGSAPDLNLLTVPTWIKEGQDDDHLQEKQKLSGDTEKLQTWGNMWGHYLTSSSPQDRDL